MMIQENVAASFISGMLFFQREAYNVLSIQSFMPTVSIQAGDSRFFSEKNRHHYFSCLRPKIPSVSMLVNGGNSFP